MTHWKRPDAEKDGRQKGKRVAKDEMAGWHHRFNGHELGQTPEMVRDREDGRAVVHGGFEESDMTWRWNNKVYYFSGTVMTERLSTTYSMMRPKDQESTAIE